MLGRPAEMARPVGPHMLARCMGYAGSSPGKMEEGPGVGDRAETWPFPGPLPHAPAWVGVRGPGTGTVPAIRGSWHRSA